MMRLRFLTVILAISALCVPAAAEMGPQPDFQWEGAFNYAVVGGTILQDTCAPDVLSGTCNPGSTDLQGDSFVDWPNWADMQGVPNDASIKQAFLVWMGSNTPNTTPDVSVTFMPPGGSPVDVTADLATQCEVISYNDQWMQGSYADFEYYTCRVDITEYLAEHVDVEGKPINGLWQYGHQTVGTEQQYIMTTGVLGAWGAIVVYQSPSIARKRLYMYQGFDKMQCGRIELHPGGFEVPDNPEAKITFFVGEGDFPISGHGQSPLSSSYCQDYSEGLTFNNQLLSDFCNPADNPYNSTRNTNIDPAAGACEFDVFSLDLDTYQVGDYLSPGDVSSTVYMDLGQDQIFTNFLLVSIDTKLPSFDIPGQPEKTCSVGDGDFVAPGEEFTYFIRVENWGEDIAHDVRVTDEIPAFTEYVCNSTYITDPDGTKVPIPDAGACLSPLTGQGYLVTGAMPVGSQNGYTIEFKVRLKGEDQGVTKETIIYNEAHISSSDAGDSYITNGGIPVRINVQLRSYEGKLSITRGPAGSSGGFAAAGTAALPITQMQLSSTEGSVLVQNISFQAQGTAVDNADIGDMKMYIDNNADGAVDGGDTLLGTKTFATDDGRILFDLNKVIAIDAPIYLLMTCDLAATIEAGKTFWVAIQDETYISVRGFIVSSSLPFESGHFAVPSGDLLTYLGSKTPLDGRIAPGATFPDMQFALKSLGSAYTLSGVTFSNKGNVYDNYVSSLKLYLDANGDGAVDGGDNLLGETTMASGQATFSGLSVTVPAAGAEVLLLLEVALTGDVLSMTRIQYGIDENGLTIDGTPEGLPLVGAEMTVSNTVDGDTDDVVVDGDTTDTDWDNGWDNMVDGDTDEPAKSSDGGCTGLAGGSAFMLLALVLGVMRRRRK